MPLPIPEISGWVFGIGGTGAIGLAAWTAWDWIPNHRKTPLFRGEDGRFYFIVRGQNVFDPSRKDDIGNAARLVTKGPVIGGFLVYKGFEYRKQGTGANSDMIIATGQSNQGVLGSGIDWIGILSVVKVHNNKWQEWGIGKDGKPGLETFIRREYGFSVQITNMASRTEPSEDKGNVPIQIDYETYWRIEDPDKAKREVDDANYKALGLLDSEIVAWINTQTIYRFETDAEGKITSASMDKKSVKEAIVLHLQTSGVYEKVREKYGYQITEFVILDVIPLAGFAELLSASAKADLEGQAELKKANWLRLKAAIEIGVQKDWAALYRTDPEAFTKDVAEAIKAFGIPISLGGSSSIETLLNGLGINTRDDVRNVTDGVIGILEKKGDDKEKDKEETENK
jgi:hypothetical protein